jgi:trimeric autotransporter adhesin
MFPFPLSRAVLLPLLMAAAQPLYAQITVSVADAEATAGRRTSMPFVVSRSGGTDVAVTVQYATQDGSAIAGRDYTATSGTLTIAAGQSSATVSVPLSGRSTSRTARSFTLNLSNPSAQPAELWAGAGNANAGRYVEGLVVADFNGDGKPDVALASIADGTVTVLRNDTVAGSSAASFSPALVLGGEAPSRLSVADLNGDGRPDLVVPNSSADRVDVYLNTTPALAGTFSFARTSLATGTFAFLSALADFDGDGRPDIAVASSANCRLAVQLNRTPAGATTPSFTPATLLAPGAPDAYCYALTTLDADGDGKADIAVSDLLTTSVVVLRNTAPPGASAPAFAAPVAFHTAGGATGIAAVDVDGDGKADLVTAENGFQTGSTFSVLLNRSAAPGAAPAFAVSSFQGAAPYAVALRDVDADGKPDLVFASLSLDNAGNGGLWVLKNSTAVGAARPALTTLASLPAGDEPHTVGIADFNADGRQDFVTIDTTSPVVGFEFGASTASLPSASLGDGSATGTIRPRR